MSDAPYTPAGEQFDDEDRIHWGHVAMVFIAFAILYFATAAFYDLSTDSKKYTVNASQTVGPIVSRKSNTVVQISVVNLSVRQSWAFVETSVVDQKGGIVTSFGGNMYHESGYDSDGSWSESEKESDVKVVLPAAGQYFLKFKVSGGSAYQTRGTDKTRSSRLSVTVEQKRGGSTILNVLGIIILVLGVVLNELRNRTVINLASRMMSKSDD